MDTRFCIEALEEALEKYGKLEIFNTDQGSQFTSDGWIMCLLSGCGGRSNMNVCSCMIGRLAQKFGLVLENGSTIITATGSHTMGLST